MRAIGVDVEHLALALGDHDLVSGMDEVRIRTALAERSVVRVLVDRAVVEEAVTTRDEREVLAIGADLGEALDEFSDGKAEMRGDGVDLGVRDDDISGPAAAVARA